MPATDPTAPPNLVAASFTSVSSLVFLQLSSKTFFYLFPQLSTSAPCYSVDLWHCNGAVESLLSTTLFLSREGVRTALLRQQKNASSSSSSPPSPNLVPNISLLPACVGVPIAVALAILYSATCTPAVRMPSHFHLSIRPLRRRRARVRTPIHPRAERTSDGCACCLPKAPRCSRRPS